jgi:hypothetical protein
MLASTLTAIGLGISAVSAGAQYSANQQAAKASRRAERLREQQMKLDAQRKRRETIRQALAATSLATARSVGQGVGEGSSVFFGAYGQTMGELGRQINYTNVSEQIGGQLFDANADYASAVSAASTFNALGNIGTGLMTNAKTIDEIGTSLFGPPTTQQSWNQGTTVRYA